MRTLLADKTGNPVTVTQDICNACCKTFEPTPADLNVVVASLLYHEVESRLKQCDLKERRRDSLLELQQRCEDSLPVMGIEEDDLPDPPSAATTIPSLDRICEILPVLDIQHGTSFQWAVGLTTAPRRLSTLERSLDLFLSCGWNELHLFVDGDVSLPDQHQHFPKTIRSPNIGAWPNYYLGLQELYCRSPHADVYMMLQDDLEWPRGWPIKEYLEKLLWPGDTPGLVSLYCGAEETSEINGWAVSSHWKWGALAFLFPRELLQQFLSDADARAHIQSTDGSALVGIDLQIGNWAAKHGIPIHRPTPSLVQHMGEISSIWSTSRAVGVRAARKYIAEFASEGRVQGEGHWD